MLTLPANFTKHSSDVNAMVRPVIVLKNGATFRYAFTFGDSFLTYGGTAQFVHGCLSKDPAPRQGIDILSRVTSQASIAVELDNKYALGATGLRVSQELSSCYGNTVELYYLCGPDAAAIEDGVLAFVGTIQAEPSFDGESVTLTVEGAAGNLWPLVPTQMSEISSDAWAAYDSPKVAPLVYGSFTNESVFWYDSKSDEAHNDPIYAPAVAEGVYLLSDNALSADPSSVLIWLPILNQYAFVPSTEYTVDLTNSSYGDRSTLTFTNMNAVHCHLLFRPHALGNFIGSDPIITNQDTTDPTTNFTYGENNFINAEKAWDGNVDTYAELLSGSQAVDDPNNKAAMKGCGIFVFPDFYDSVGCPFITIDEDHVNLIYKCNKVAISNLTRSYGTATPYQTVIAVHYDTVGTVICEDANTWDDGTVNTLNLPASFNFDSTVGYKMAEHNVRVYVTFMAENTSTFSPATIAEAIGLRVHEMAIEFGVSVDLANIRGAAFWHGSGPNMPSAITDRAAIPTGMNDDAAIVIETLLRDQVGLATAAIDTDSFDACYGVADVQLVIEGTERVGADELIQEICENAGMMLHMDFTGKARISFVAPADPVAVDATIYAYDLATLPGISYTPKSSIANSFAIDYAYRTTGEPETSIKFERVRKLARGVAAQYPAVASGSRGAEVPSRGASISVYGEDATSIAKYGKRQLSVSYRFGTPTTVINVGTAMSAPLNRRLVDLMSNQHQILTVKTLGMRLAAVEIFDWIALDGTSIDPLIKLNDATWTGNMYHVIDKQWTVDGIKFTAVKYERVYY